MKLIISMSLQSLDFNTFYFVKPPNVSSSYEIELFINSITPLFDKAQINSESEFQNLLNVDKKISQPVNQMKINMSV